MRYALLTVATVTMTLALAAATARAEAGYTLGKWSPGVGNAINAIYFHFCGKRYRWCEAGSQAVRVAECESRFYVWASNGQYLGLFQMGSYARGRYGHSWNPWGQARSAYRYFVDAGRDWSPWSCKPW